MEKKVIIKKISEKLERRLAELRGSIEDLQKQVINSPNAMQSWSDTSRSQIRGVIANLQPQTVQLEKCIGELKAVDVDRIYKKVDIGALVVVGSKTERAYYFLAPEGAGAETMAINGLELTTLAASSSLGQKIKDKKEKEKIEFTDQHLEILEIL